MCSIKCVAFVRGHLFSTSLYASFYLLYHNTISWTSPKITIALLFITCSLQNGILFLPWEKVVWPWSKPDQLDYLLLLSLQALIIIQMLNLWLCLLSGTCYQHFVCTKKHLYSYSTGRKTCKSICSSIKCYIIILYFVMWFCTQWKQSSNLSLYSLDSDLTSSSIGK